MMRGKGRGNVRRRIRRRIRRRGRQGEENKRKRANPLVSLLYHGAS
jgi:hypothetical protein